MKSFLTAVVAIALIIALIGGSLWLCATCFDYSLMTITGKDVPWGYDLLGGVLLAPVNLPLAGICLIVNAAGVPSPWIG